MAPRTRLYVAIAVGAALGSVARHLCGVAALALFGPAFPVGTLGVNVAGSFVIGLYATLTEPDGRVFATPAMLQGVMGGFCGGFTTFSSFSLQTLDLMRSGAMARAAANVALSVLLCVAAVALGHAIDARFNGGDVRIAQATIEEEG